MGLRDRRERVEAGEDPRERVAARELEEAVAVERVERDVEALDARGDERGGVALEQEAVGGQRQVAHARQRREHRDQARQVAPDERLAAGQPHVADAHLREQAHDALELLEGQDLVAVEPGQALGGHAVLAAEVAAIGDRDAHIADRAAVPVDQLLADHHGKPTPAAPPTRLRQSSSSVTASSKTAVWAPTSCGVVVGAISAMLWNGVIRTPRFCAWRCR